MKKILSVLAAAFFALTSAQGQDLQSANSDFDKGLYTTALTKYEALVNAADQETAFAARIKEAQTLLALAKYDTAAQKIYSYPLPEDNIWKARFLLYRSFVASEVTKTYGRYMSTDEQENADGTQLTKAQWEEKIEQDYNALWALRSQLINADILEESLILNTKDIDSERIPTLYDFLVTRLESYILDKVNQSDIVPLKAETIMGDKYKQAASTDWNIVRLANIYEESYQFRNNSLRESAREFWRVDRVMLPIKYPRYFTFSDEAAAKKEAAGLLASWAEYAKTIEKPSFFARIAATFSRTSHFTPYAKSYAAHNAGNIYNGIEEYEQAFDVYSYCSTLDKQSYSSLCAQAAQNIAAEVLNIGSTEAAPNPEDINLPLTLRNVPTVYGRVYKTTEAELKKLNPNYRSDKNYGYLTGIDTYQKDAELAAILAKQPYLSFEQDFVYDKKYGFLKEAKLKVPQLSDRGFYIVAVSTDNAFDPANSTIKLGVVNITNVMLVSVKGIQDNPQKYIFDFEKPSQTYKADYFKLYTLNPVTGEPVKGADVNYYLRTNSTTTSSSKRTDADGVANIGSTFKLGRHNDLYANLSPLVKYNDAYALLNYSDYFSHYQQSPINIYIETDRAIYRPGQEVKIKVIALERTPRGVRTYSRPYPVKIEVRDANYKTVATHTVKLNNFGSAVYTYKTPETGLLGNYGINAIIDDKAWEASGYINFSVEEYKRPEFEVSLKNAEAPWQYNSTVKVEGQAKYYFGTGVQNARVEYKVQRQDYIPYFWWWYRWMNPNSGTEEVLQGKTNGDASGNFSFTFTPVEKQSKYPSVRALPSRYIVTVNVFDDGGRTITSSKNYLASKDSHMFKVDMPTGFATENQEYKFDLSLVDINEGVYEGTGTVEVYSLNKEYDKTKSSLEEAFADTKDAAKVHNATVAFNKTKPTQVTLPGMKEGVYRIKIKDSKTPAEQTVLLVVASANPQLQLPAVTIAERSTYYPGETAKVLIGTDAIKVAKHAHVMQGNFMLTATALGAGTAIYQIPVTTQHRDGLTLQWFGVSDYKTYTGKVDLNVPHNDKELDVKLTAPESIEPGKNIKLTLSAKDYQGKAVNAEALVKVYDRSLDYYATNSSGLSTQSLYPKMSNYNNPASSFFNTYYANFTNKKTPHTPYVSPKPLPVFVMEYGYRHIYPMYGAVMETASMDMAAPMMARNTASVKSSARMMKQESAANDDAYLAEPEMAFGGAVATAAAGAAERGGEASAVRTDMSETAYFGPQTAVTNGKADITFKMPERLTSWQMSAVVLTQNALLGTAKAQTVTKKDLMVRLEMPRFFREGDKGQIRAILSNETNQDKNVDVLLIVKDGGDTAIHKLGLTEAKKTVLVRANAQATAIWETEIKAQPTTLGITATATSGSLKDGEYKELPILPSRERLADTRVTALKQGDNTLELAMLKHPDPTRSYDSIALQVDPNLILPVLNSMPMLVQYPYENLDSLITKYVPLAIINKFYNNYPELKKAVAKIPKRDTITPPWDNDNPSRLMMLSETPWLYEAEGRKVEYGNIIDLFEPKLVNSMEKKTVKRIETYQNSDGGFPWFNGGKSSTYITLYVLDSLSHAANFDVAIPEKMTKRAMTYVYNDIQNVIKDTDNVGTHQVVLSLYAAYVLTSFPSEWKETQQILKDVKTWVDYAAQYRQFMTPLGKIYAANIYHRLGDKEKSDQYLDAVLDIMTIDETTGAYFTPEERSWLWYSDTLEKHAITLQTLLKLRPEDKRIDDMVKWMMFNRKGTSWRSTKATASAVYTLLDVMQKRGAFKEDATYQVTWSAVSDKQTFKPFDFVEKPLRYVKTGLEANDTYLTAHVNKTGPSVDFASLTAVYSTDGKVEESEAGLLNVSRKYFIRKKEGDVYKLFDVANGHKINVGDEIEVHLTVKTSSQFEYVLIKDARPAGFEAETLTSGWKWGTDLTRYEEPRDSMTNFFVNWLPHGTYVLKYKLRPTLPGTYKVGAAQIQSMMAPEFAAHSDNFVITVEK
ncbi:YfaS [Elusimicrobium simillimum]|uniref:alpha-2-macroglobulin family protein n=1 Tax=Elusimicrobium simillimum TaxID=3143438 RepID=UPI003C6F956E